MSSAMRGLGRAFGAVARMVLTVALLSAFAVPVANVARAAETQSVGGKEGKKPVRIKQGDSCKRRTDDVPGVVKRDGCGRWYCGRADVKDITELVPNIEEVAQCKWHLEGQRCLCRKFSTAPGK